MSLVARLTLEPTMTNITLLLKILFPRRWSKFHPRLSGSPRLFRRRTARVGQTDVLEVVFVPVACGPAVTRALVIGGIAVGTGVDMVREEEGREAADEGQLACSAVYAGDMAVAAFGDGGGFGAFGGRFADGFAEGRGGFSG
jgi:hypothetical protein